MLVILHEPYFEESPFKFYFLWIAHLLTDVELEKKTFLSDLSLEFEED